MPLGRLRTAFYGAGVIMPFALELAVLGFLRAASGRW